MGKSSIQLHSTLPNTHNSYSRRSFTLASLTSHSINTSSACSRSALFIHRRFASSLIPNRSTISLPQRPTVGVRSVVKTPLNNITATRRLEHVSDPFFLVTWFISDYKSHCLPHSPHILFCHRFATHSPQCLLFPKTKPRTTSMTCLSSEEDPEDLLVP